MDDRIAVLTSESLRKAGFAHGFTMRSRGGAGAAGEPLDFAILRDPVRLRESQRLLAEAIGFEPDRLYQATQVHGRTVAPAAGDPAELVAKEADAIVAEPASGAAACVRVADCVPVLVADPASGRVAAVHAGWRGVVSGVLEAALERMREAEGAGAPSGYVAAIGPCIGGCCFEVGRDVAEQIRAASEVGAWDARWGEVIARRDEAKGKAYVDLRVAVRRKLHAAGLPYASIDDVAGCTRCDADRFHSFRRDGDASGRLVGVIVARGDAR